MASPIIVGFCALELLCQSCHVYFKKKHCTEFSIVRDEKHAVCIMNVNCLNLHMLLFGMLRYKQSLVHWRMYLSACCEMLDVMRNDGAFTQPDRPGFLNKVRFTHIPPHVHRETANFSKTVLRGHLYCSDILHSLRILKWFLLFFFFFFFVL